MVSLRAEFPAPGARLAFPFKSTLGLFQYFTGSGFLGAIALALFGTGVILLWTGRAGLKRDKSRALAMLMTVPFILLDGRRVRRLISLWRNTPYRCDRTFMACGIAIVIGTLRWRAAMVILWGALALTPVWYRTAEEDPDDISADRNRREMMLQGLAYMHASIPAGAIIFTDRETQLMLSYYEGGPIPAPHPGSRFVETRSGQAMASLGGEIHIRH